MHPARFVRPKRTFLAIPILVAGTNSFSSGNIVEESFFDKYFAEKLKPVHSLIFYPGKLSGPN
jgi:hypothetical protein